MKILKKEMLWGLAVLGLLLFVDPDKAAAQQAGPEGKGPEAVELPVDISIDVITRNENIPHSTEFTIDVINSQSENEIHLILPGPGPRSPGEPPVTVTKPDAPPISEPPPSESPPPVEAPPADAPPVIETPPPAEVPPVEAPPISEPAPGVPPHP
jgi:hypothetical protein